MELQNFNQSGLEQAIAVLKPCLDIKRWYEKLIAARPFAHFSEIENLTKTILPFSQEEITKALAQHPRIGEKHSNGEKHHQQQEQYFSNQEQASLGEKEEKILDIIYQGNLAYEKRFNQVFLIRAKGRSYQEIAENLQRRLQNNFADEQKEIQQQLIEIALLRLKTLLHIDMSKR